MQSLTVKMFQRNVINLGLLVSLTASLGALAFGKKGIHGLLGTAFLGFSMAHILRHKRGLINWLNKS